MNSYYKKINNCLNCDDANVKVGKWKLYEILCTNCNKKLLATKIADAKIPDWCPRLAEDQVLMSKSDVVELQKYRMMLLDDMK